MELFPPREAIICDFKLVTILFSTSPRSSLLRVGCFDHTVPLCFDSVKVVSHDVRSHGGAKIIEEGKICEGKRVERKMTCISGVRCVSRDSESATSLVSPGKCWLYKTQ